MMIPNRPNMLCGWIGAAAAAAVFVLDILTPPGIAIPMLYAVPVLGAWFATDWRSTAVMAGGVILSTWLGLWFSPGVISLEAIANRILISIALIVIAGLLVKAKQSAEQVEEAQDALRESEQQLRLFITHAPVAIAMFDGHMRYMEASHRWLADYGIDGQGLSGRSHYEIFPDIPERWKEIHRRCLSGAVERSEEDLIVRADGSSRWIQWELRPWLTASGNVGGLVMFTEDITERKRAEEVVGEMNATLEQQVSKRNSDLVVANERFEWVTRATQDGVFDWDLLHDRVFYSPRWKEIHGFSEADLPEAVNDWSARIHPEDRERVLGRLEDYLERRRDEFWEEYRIRRKDGRDIWVLDRGVALWDGQGRAIRIVGSETDITWRKETEKTLGRREREFHILADNVPALFSYVDRDRRYRFVNRQFEEFFRRPSEEIVGLAMHELLGTEGYAAMQQPLDRAFGGQTVSFEYHLPVPDGQARWFIAQYVPDRDGEGALTGLFILATDITSIKAIERLLKEREAQLESLSAKLVEAQEEERRRIARELHDDFTQRLATLTIELDMHRLGLTKSDPSRSSFLALREGLARMTSDIQRLAHGLHPSILDHAGLESAVREHADEFAARSGLAVEVSARDVPRVIPHDRATCLYRVLQESLQNVRKHAQASTVLIRLMRTPDGIGLCVHDDGHGFEQAQAGPHRNGLGLTSMKERVRLYNGTFRVRTKLGDGTEVHVWVPLENTTGEG